MVDFVGPVETYKLSRSLIEAGDVFFLLGLREPGQVLGQVNSFDEERWITVDSISATGKLNIRIEAFFKGERMAGSEPTLESVPYDLALKLVEDRVWLSKEDL